MSTNVNRINLCSASRPRLLSLDEDASDLLSDKILLSPRANKVMPVLLEPEIEDEVLLAQSQMNLNNEQVTLHPSAVGDNMSIA